jgi:phosphoglucosamine mutase
LIRPQVADLQKRTWPTLQEPSRTNAARPVRYATVGRLFGTDGIRGLANKDLTGELAYRLGRAAVVALTEHGDRRPHIVVGRDTRASGESLEAGLAAGICAAGGDAILLGVCTTPGVAFLTRDLDANAGAVISASHNPAEYNGIKFFAATGYKLPDRLEDEIETLVGSDEDPRPQAGQPGRPVRVDDGTERYLRHLESSAEGSLEGLKLVVDCANGAATGLAPELFRRLGAEVVSINDRPDGWNINQRSGATAPNVVAKAVVEQRADAGVAHDGDADRALFADAEGSVIDGDHVLAACALAMHETGDLANDLVVTTVMANLGFRICMDEAGIKIAETKVGDRYVLEEMLRSGSVLGGEQSGHIIFLKSATTGDGLLTAVRFLGLAVRKGVSVAELASSMRRFPQVLLNVEVANPATVDSASPVWDAVAGVERALGASGRILVRASGTEPLVRVMVEASTEQQARQHAEAIATIVDEVLGARSERSG